ncbi:desulfoferrodoxin FeS4 iron-binding domain-containing protein [Candidatus Bipolaricaulota bacterium]
MVRKTDPGYSAGQPQSGRIEEEIKMAELDKVYVCDLCGQEIRVTKSGAGTLVCCDVPMHAKAN